MTIEMFARKLYVNNEDDFRLQIADFRLRSVIGKKQSEIFNLKSEIVSVG